MRHRTGRGRTYSWNTTYEGVIPNLQRRYRDTESDHTRSEIERYMAQRACRSCTGARLRPEALGVLVCGRNIIEVTGLTIGEGLNWVRSIKPVADSPDQIPANGSNGNGHHPPETLPPDTLSNNAPQPSANGSNGKGRRNRRNGRRSPATDAPEPPDPARNGHCRSDPQGD